MCINSSNDDSIMVSIICNAYNHGEYIKDALEGFVVQKTTFPFEILIHDDASTDDTAEIIRQYERKYPELIKPIYQRENQHSQNISISNTFQYPRAKGRYIALCEGDDYWIDDHKLQKQFDAMEKCQEVDMCAHTASIKIGGKYKGLIMPKDKMCIIETNEVIQGGGGYFATNSLFFRRNIFKDVPSFRIAYQIDYSLQIWGSLRGGVLFIPDNMSVYRKFNKNSWSLRMRKDAGAMEKSLKKIEEMLNILNAETHYNYNDIIQERISANWVRQLFLEHKYYELKHGRWGEYYSKMPIHLKVKLYIESLKSRLIF